MASCIWLFRLVNIPLHNTAYLKPRRSNKVLVAYYITLSMQRNAWNIETSIYILKSEEVNRVQACPRVHEENGNKVNFVEGTKANC